MKIITKTMETKIQKIGGRNNLTVEYKGQVFIIKCSPEDVAYFKRNIDVMINRFKTDILDSLNKKS